MPVGVPEPRSGEGVPLFGVEGVQVHVSTMNGIARAGMTGSVPRLGLALVILSPHEVVDHRFFPRQTPNLWAMVCTVLLLTLNFCPISFCVNSGCSIKVSRTCRCRSCDSSVPP